MLLERHLKIVRNKLVKHGVTNAAYQLSGDYSRLRQILEKEGLELTNEEIRLALLERLPDESRNLQEPT